ncbi:hypothetical protein OS493_012254 [Desmophyllum pertusum]|uniref:Uncharacterized protein n=1 Tax=Desmophyllum pertusum TaxID=174260 RepID=A0A9W9ZQG2_9CNID|nr:hypothetical protein OS493_012254 [Desmophyllum pertusum]
MNLAYKFKKKTNQELRASGICPEPTELDRLLEEIAERSEASEQSRDEDDNARVKLRKEQEQAKDVRLTAMESLAETKKRTDEDAIKLYGNGEEDQVIFLTPSAGKQPIFIERIVASDTDNDTASVTDRVCERACLMIQSLTLEREQLALWRQERERQEQELHEMRI